MGLKFSVSVRLQSSVPATHLCVMINTYLPQGKNVEGILLSP